VDVKNPLIIDPEGKVTHPYIAPITGITEKYGGIKVPGEWVQERLYSLL
jgi:hypothetical protein